MANITRYFTLLNLSYYESLLHIQLICQYFTKGFARGKELLKEVEDKVSFYENAENEDKGTYL